MAADPSGDRGEDPFQAGRERDMGAQERDLAASRRDAAGDLRDLAGAARDSDSEERDATGRRRDVAADERDRAAEARDRGAPGTMDLPLEARFDAAREHAASDRSHSARDRDAGAQDRSTSELDRATSLADRKAGGAERSGSERDRIDGSSDRLVAAGERAYAALDELTGARSRGAGVAELTREMARAGRTSEPLTLAYVDVDHLKEINDSRGHAAGDDALVSVVRIIQRNLRSYDLVVRLGGDEFICVLAGLDAARTLTRVAAINAELAADQRLPSVTVGVTEMVAGESPADLIARADADLYARRAMQRGSPDLPER